MLPRRHAITNLRGCEYAGARPRCLTAEIALVYDGDRGSAFREEIRGRQADNTATDNQHVGMLAHTFYDSKDAVGKPLRRRYN